MDSDVFIDHQLVMRSYDIGPESMHIKQLILNPIDLGD